MNEVNELNKIRLQITSQIEEFEQKIKANANSDSNSNLKSFEQSLVRDFIENHYNEMLHHLNQIKYHLSKVNYHQKELEEGELHLAQEIETYGGDCNLRQKEDKIRIKSRKTVRSTSLKNVLQWEKLLDQQKEENLTYKIKKGIRNAQPENELEFLKTDDISKIMVKSRVLLFEGRQKPRRVSSTFENYLDCILEKPTRTQSFPSLEVLEEKSSELDRPRSCEITCNLNNTNGPTEDKIDTQNSKQEEIFVIVEPSAEEYYPQKNKNFDEKNVQIISQNENPILTENDLRKPKIIEVHLKQDVPLL